MKIELPEIRPEERTALLEALLGIIRQLADRVAELEEVQRELRDEIAVLKGQKPRPKISPSILTTTTENSDAADKKPRQRGKPSRPKTAELTIHHETPLHLAELPEGARFRCFEPYVVQDLIVQNDNTKYLRAGRCR